MVPTQLKEYNTHHFTLLSDFYMLWNALKFWTSFTFTVALFDSNKMMVPANVLILTFFLLLSSLGSCSASKTEVQRSASALGYAAHAVSLIASYLQVPLRYPLRLGGSGSHTNDHAPSVESESSDLSSDTALSANVKKTEFPLFLECQDTTRAAYAVFLLNKVKLRLLSAKEVVEMHGPRHVLANLKELLRPVQSSEYIDTGIKF
ncbi:hypothetical protein V6N12_046802 [Hibiscus sabdariffa]|uniref:Uncharacterized protein n=1 Tax=Hibiscus sabdariffa TaxID=183260 RepID=A0ABR1ZYN5_9ROSI